MSKFINILSSGGTGDVLLSIRLKFLLNYLHPGWVITNHLCLRDETWNMIKTIYPTWSQNGCLKKLPENYLDSIKTKEQLDNFDKLAENYIIFPDKLFRGIGAPPLKTWGITNFLVKQTRTLIGKWKPENYISLAINSITDGYTYHSVPELAYKLAREFPDKTIYLPLLTTWNNKDTIKFNFPHPPDNLEIEINPAFSKVYDILCKSEYSICTDNAILHILDDLGAPYLLLDPQFNKGAFESRWRTAAFYHSVPINSLVDDVLSLIKTQIYVPETQMIGADKIFRQDKDFTKELIFKE